MKVSQYYTEKLSKFWGNRSRYNNRFYDIIIYRGYRKI